jgi:hypothetical protein
MRCRHAEKLIFDYIDGTISESDRLRLEEHLGECRTCEAASSALARSLGVLHGLPKAEPSENFNWKLRLRLARERNAWRGSAESESAWQRAWQTRFGLAALSAFAVVVVAGFVFLRLSPIGVVPQGIDLQPAGRSAVSADRVTAERTREDVPAEQTDPFGLRGYGGFFPRAVSTSPSRLDLGWVDGSSILEADSLGYRSITSAKDYQRIRQLEQQIEILRKELANCNMRQSE